MIWNWDYVHQIMPELLIGVWYTVLVTMASSAIALVGGLVIAMVETTRLGPLRLIVRILLEIPRGVPILVLLFFGFYVLPEHGIFLSNMLVGILTLGLVYAAFNSEIYRGSLLTIPNELRDACTALHLSAYTRWTRILIPLMIKRSAPALLNNIIAIVRQTTFLFAIGVPVLMGKAQLLGFQTFRYLEPFTLAGLLYVALNIPLLWLLSRIKQENL